MMRGFVVLIVALFSVLFLKRKQYRHHVVSLIVLVSGVALVGVSSMISSDSEGGSS
jgi:drug/metabolite transporter (DMT)-like permease